MKVPPPVSVICAVLLFHLPAGAANLVVNWNAEVITALKREATAPLLVARTLAILHLSMEKAVTDDESETAATGAAYTVAISLLPSHRGAFEKLRDSEMKDSRDEKLTVAYQAGCRAAEDILKSHENDGCSMQVSYVPQFAPGKWRRTPPFLRPPELVQWADKVQPFALKTPDQFRPPAPPALDSAGYAEDYNELKKIGGKTSETRTAEQAGIAKFWSDFSYTETPPGHWNSIARTLAVQRELSLKDSARLFAMLNVALVDAGIACWDAKYHFNAWRPVTAIRAGADDGNPATAPVADWTPLLNTPAHPEYPSGHSAFSGAAAVVLAKLLGGNHIEFSVSSDAVPSVSRKFSSLSACAEECGESRVFCGIHFRFACEAGLELGKKVGDAVLKSPDFN